MEQDEIARLRDGCTRGLTGHGLRRPADQLADLPGGIEGDTYGDGGVVTELETEVAGLLGGAAAVFVPSGTMAQQIALRIHADRRGRRTVAFHPACHIDTHEGRGYERLHGLVGRPVGDRDRLLTRADLEDVAEPLAAVVLELPQRDLGGQLPDWDDLVDQTSWARDRGAAVHLDGARLWQCGPAYDRPLTEITALFDTTYVSFYKDLGGITGACLVGEEDVIAEAREWRHRHGGTLFGLWPYAASALVGLRTRLPRMSAYRDHAIAIAAALDGQDGVRVVPRVPQTSMLHLHLRTTEEAFAGAVRRLATEERTWTWGSSYATGQPDWRAVELTVGDATLGFTPDEVAELVDRLLTAGIG